MTTTEVLLAAKQKVNADTWAQGPGLRNIGKICAMGAIDDIVSESIPLATQREEALDVFREACGNSLITVWNDAPERTLGEVLAMFDKSIAIARGRRL